MGESATGSMVEKVPPYKKRANQELIVIMSLQLLLEALVVIETVSVLRHA